MSENDLRSCSDCFHHVLNCADFSFIFSTLNVEISTFSSLSSLFGRKLAILVSSWLQKVVTTYSNLSYLYIKEKTVRVYVSCCYYYCVTLQLWSPTAPTLWVLWLKQPQALWLTCCATFFGVIATKREQASAIKISAQPNPSSRNR